MPAALPGVMDSGGCPAVYVRAGTPWCFRALLFFRAWSRTDRIVSPRIGCVPMAHQHLVRSLRIANVHRIHDREGHHVVLDLTG